MRILVSSLYIVVFTELLKRLELWTAQGIILFIVMPDGFGSFWYVAACLEGFHNHNSRQPGMNGINHAQIVLLPIEETGCDRPKFFSDLCH